jgi:hypothetical protein
LNQTEFFKRAKNEFEMSRKKFLRLLKKGEGRFWAKSRGQNHGAMVYCPLVSEDAENSEAQPSGNTDLSPCSIINNSMETGPTCSTCPSCSPPLGGTEDKGDRRKEQGFWDALEEEDEGE